MARSCRPRALRTRPPQLSALSAFCAPFAVNNHTVGVRAAAAAAAAAYKQTGCSKADSYRGGHQASCDYGLMRWHGNDRPSSEGCREGRLEQEHGDKRGKKRHVILVRTAQEPPLEAARKKKKNLNSRCEGLLTAEERKFLELNSRGS